MKLCINIRGASNYAEALNPFRHGRRRLSYCQTRISSY